VSQSCQDFLARAGGPKCGKGAGGPSCGDRIATFIIVLDPAEEGGHTAFPRAGMTQKAIAGIDVHDAGNIPWYCNTKYADKVLQASAKKGDGLLFWDYAPNENDPTDALEVDGSQHSGCPVVKGEKWIVTRWIRASEFV
jgi:prolyl 4-hydroxylase